MNSTNKKPSRKGPWKIILAVLGSVIAFCCACLAFTGIMDALGFIPTLTPTLTHTATATITLIPSSTITLTSTITSTPTITNTPGPTFTLLPTRTSTSLPTATLIVIIPTQPQQQVVCSCSGDSYNCGDFDRHSQAQACFNYCVSQGKGDIHRLDGDGNGLACESLP